MLLGIGFFSVPHIFHHRIRHQQVNGSPLLPKLVGEVLACGVDRVSAGSSGKVADHRGFHIHARLHSMILQVMQVLRVAPRCVVNVASLLSSLVLSVAPARFLVTS